MVIVLLPFLIARNRFSINLKKIVTKTVHVIFFFRNPSKISVNYHLKSWMYQGLQDTWHGRCSGEGIGDGYPYLCTSSWPEVLPWTWEIWPRTIQWRWKGEETSLRVFALRRGSEDMYRYVRCFISYITITIVLETEYAFNLLPAHIQYINVDYNFVHY